MDDRDRPRNGRHSIKYSLDKVLVCQAQNVLHVELDSFLQMEKTNAPNVEQANLKPLKVMMVVVVDIVTTKFYFFNIFSNAEKVLITQTRYF